MARAKQTNRAEARRRYRQANQPFSPALEDDDALDAAPATGAAARPAPSKAAAPTVQRPSIFAAFRGAYRPANVGQDLRLLPRLLGSRAFIAGIAVLMVGAGLFAAFPRYDGSLTAWDLIVRPGQALLPAAVVGLFAPRASYLLGTVVGVVQAVVFVVQVPQYVDLLAFVGAPVPDGYLDSLRLSAWIAPLYGALFAAAAAWYRRFLSLSSPRRAQQSRPGAKPAQRRSAARR